MRINMALMRIILGAAMVAAAAAGYAPQCRCSEPSTRHPPVEPCSGVFCENGGTCEADGESFLCVCTEGYEGQFCQNAVGLSSCEDVDCNRGLCVEEGGVARCVCLQGGTGQFCENDLCLQVDCRGSQIECVVKEHVSDGEYPFDCICEGTFPEVGGTFCDELGCSHIFLACSSNGMCIDPDERENRPPEIALCDCQGYFGPDCQYDVCSDGFECQNGGSCRFVEEQLVGCECPDGFEGDMCEIVSCLGVSCENGGTCQVEGDSVSCSCPEGLAGELCENDLSMCFGVTCLNGGTCAGTLAVNARCLCIEGYSGDRCQFGPCLRGQLPTFCQNGGSCLADRKYNRLLGCVCAEGFSGTMCEVGPCPYDVVCENGGVCVIVDGDFNSCRCPQGFGGDRCQFSLV